MNIFYTTSMEYESRPSSGAWVHIHSVVRLLRARGHRVTLFACRPKKAPETAAGEPAVEYVGRLPKSPAGLVRFNLAYGACLKRRWTPEVDLIYSRFGLWQFSPILFAKRRGIPLILEVNGVPDQERRLNPLHDRMLRWVFHSADRIVVVADRMGEHFARRYRVPAERFVTIKNGVDCDLYRPLENDRRQSVPEGRPAIGYVGSLDFNWEIALLWEAAPRILQQVPSAVFVVAGKGPMAGPLQEAFAQQGLSDHLLYKGPVPQSEAGRLTAECDVLVAPFKALERNDMMSPMKVYHYLAVGVPTVASEMQVMEQFEGSGLITFKPGDAAAFSEAILHCLALSPEERKRLGQQGRAFILQHYTWEHTVSHVEEVIQQVVGSRS